MLLLSVTLAASAAGSGCCPRNPLQNTAVAAHGNTDWHIDTANEFLFGTDMGGAVTAANHAPDTWTRRHIHTDLTNTAHFYADGDDKDATSGIDRAMLFFYAGHGSPTSWDALGDHGSQSSCLLGDCKSGTGGARYYWQCSCEVFAHGPKTCAAGGWEYGCPGDFDGSADSAAMRNVYERWGPALSKELRMACGASTSAYCHEAQANAIWDNYNNKGLDVADSFIQGLTVWGDVVVPLCITLGGADVTATPLYDATFTNAANASGTSTYHIQWGSSFASRPKTAPLIPARLPIYEVRPAPIPERIAKLAMQKTDGQLVSTDTTAGAGFETRVNLRSGAIYLKGAHLAPRAETRLSADQVRASAKRFLEARGLAEAGAEEPDITQHMVQSRSVEQGSKPGEPMQKAVAYVIRRTIEVDGVKIPVVGAGGRIELFLNPDGSVQRMAKTWRSLGAVARVAAVKPYETALAEAQRRLGNAASAYALQTWEFGYDEADGNADQKELRAVYQFGFAPKEKQRDDHGILLNPPRMITIPAQE